ncbi:hypothetical protein M153_1524000414 [Pseudoloma neurophilia]|uniref:Uncharacterized protein n=1 Tax=Pseudoloma neurophilia TaxID=146866 RepID=A0A0R0M3Z4_9MICR|nr:hypothetical protein M153_1524000414 [Pseudoloma neurophilia]
MKDKYSLISSENLNSYQNNNNSFPNNSQMNGGYMHPSVSIQGKIEMIASQM